MTYLYCLVRSSRRPSPGRVRGVPGAGPVRPLDAGQGLWLVVADVGAEYGEAAIARGLTDLDWVSRRALGHEAVVERFLRAAAVLPMQMLTIFTSDERALAHVAGDRRRIERILTRVAGRQEWGLRLTWDEQAARTVVERTHAGAAETRSGIAYLARKRDLRDVSRSQLAGARKAATAVHRRLVAQADDAVRRTSTEQAAPGSRLLLDAAYLVPAAEAAAFRAAVREASRALAPSGIGASLSGPWPPYNFIGR